MRAPAIALLLLSLGCANHLGYSENLEQVVRRDLVKSHVAVRTAQDVISSPRVVVEIIGQEAVEVRTERVVTRFEEATPYQGAREFYEVPAGLVSLPLSLLFNVFDTLLLGYVPNELVDGYTFWTFAALNPFMNAESKKRIRRRVVSKETQLVDFQVEQVDRPLAGRTVGVAFDQFDPVEIQTDSRGQISVHLVEVAPEGLSTPPRKLVLSVEGEDQRRWIYLDRDLADRLYRAAVVKAAFGAPEIDPQDAARGILELERLGFNGYSRMLEDRVIEAYRDDPVDSRLFAEALRAASSTPAAPAR